MNKNIFRKININNLPSKLLQKINVNTFKYFSLNSTTHKTTTYKITSTNSYNYSTTTSTPKIQKIYEYKNSSLKSRIIFYGHMLFIYGNSLLLHFEIFHPTIGNFHGLMLTLSLAVSWFSYIVIGNIMKKTVNKIYKIEKGKDVVYKIEFISFMYSPKSEIVSKRDLVDYTQSNIEGFYFVRNRMNKYRKIYVNPGKNLLAGEYELDREFRELINQIE